MIIEQRHTAKEVGSGDLAVFATPMMVALMEGEAMNVAGSECTDAETTVGTLVNVAHLRATAVGDEVYAKATLTQRDGRKLTFRVEAHDSKGLIGEGTHERYIVNREKFLAKL